MLCLVLLQLYISCFGIFLVLQLLGRVQIQIQWSRPTSIHPNFNKGFGLIPFCMFMPYLFFSMPLCVFAMFLFVFPLWVCDCWSLGPLCLFGCIRPFQCLVQMQPCLGVHLHDVWLACRLPFSLWLSFACWGFSCQPFYVPFNMFTLPLYVITCFASFILAMLALCHLVWLSSFVCIFASLFICSCMRVVCLFVSSSLVPTYNLVQVHSHLYTQDRESLLGTLLDGMCVACTLK